MAKSKITSDDFLKLLDDEEESSQPPAYSPVSRDNNVVSGPAVKALAQNKLPTNYQQTGNKLPTDDLSENPKVPTKVPTELPTKYQQTGNKLPTKSGFLALSGLQRNLVVFLYQLCRMRGERELENIRIDYLAVSLETTAGAVKETVRRLEKKAIIKRTGYRNGRGGSSNYSLLEETYKEVFQLESTNKLVTNYQQTTNKVVSEVPTKVPTSPLSSSRDVFFNKKISTTKIVDNFEFSLGSALEFGITESSIARCFELYPTLEQEKMQDLINRYAQFMTTPDGKRVKNARGFFISLAKQLSEGITPLDHIETPEALLMREFANKSRERKEQETKLEEESLEFSFEEWLEGLPKEKQAELIPEGQFAKTGSVPHRAALKKYFTENLWASKRQAILKQEIASL